MRDIQYTVHVSEGYVSRVIDSCREYTYDEYGRTLSNDYYKYINNDFVFDNGVEYVYDEDGLTFVNWYKDNTDFIKPLLLPRAKNQLDELMNLFAGIGTRFVFSDKFKYQWNYEIKNDNTKDRIIKRFEEASRGGLLFPAKDDPRESKYKIVRKDDRGTGVFELRLRDIGVRIYFACDYNTIKILLYGTKTSHQGNGQESDFRIANSILNKM